MLGSESAQCDSDLVRQVLATLRPDDQEILRLLTWEELSHAEAAVVLDCSVNAVAIRASRARQRFARALHTAPSATSMRRSS
ncbi:MAG: RNA polymerase sigma factor [Actinomycetota bacterium]